jgi:hypothetical protein
MRYNVRWTGRKPVPDWSGAGLYSDPDETSRLSGALLELSGPSKKDGFATLDDSSVQVRAGSRDLIVRFQSSMDPSDLTPRALVVGSLGLDLLGASAGPFLNVGMGGESDLIWWTDSTGRVARFSIRTPLVFRSSASGIKVIGPDGKEVPQQPPPPPQLHESFRYFRLSQCTDDLFDAFRNAYLALESALADLLPKAANQTEASWLKQALALAETHATLHVHLGCSPAETPDRLYDDVYRPVRCPLFHGKALGLDPASTTDRDRVFTAYVAVLECYLALARVRYGLRTAGGGGLTPNGFASLVSFMDEWSVRAGMGEGEHEYGELGEFDPQYVEPQPEHVLRFARAMAPFDERLASVSFVAAFHEGELAFWHGLSGTLGTQDLDALEVLIDLWNSTDFGYRTAFAG